MECRFKGELCDGHVHMTAEEFVANKVKTNTYKRMKKLGKIANNPILAEDVREVLRSALYYYQASIMENDDDEVIKDLQEMMNDAWIMKNAPYYLPVISKAIGIIQRKVVGTDV